MKQYTMAELQTLSRPSLEQAAREWNRRPWNQVPEMKEDTK